MVEELDVVLDDGRVLHAYDTGGAERIPVFWHHGTPNIGTPPAPLFAAADELGIRLLGYDRPGYGGSTPVPDRAVGTAAADVATIADAVGIDELAVMGHSGGGPHALACAALLGGRVTAAVSVSGPAPFTAERLDWFAGMSAAGSASLRAAADGREVKQEYEATAPESDPGFVAADWAALAGEWSWFGSVVGPALASGPGGLIDDDLALVAPWGFDPADVAAPVLLLHGALDQVVPSSHGVWLADRCPDAQLTVLPQDGHVSVLRSAAGALEWLRERTAHSGRPGSDRQR